MNDPTCRVDVMTNASVQVRMNENKHVIRQIVGAVLFLAKQDLPIWGDVDTTYTTGTTLVLDSMQSVNLHTRTSLVLLGITLLYFRHLHHFRHLHLTMKTSQSAHFPPVLSHKQLLIVAHSR